MSRRRFGDELAPKPFNFVPFAGKTERRSVPGHDYVASDHYSGQLVYQLEALTPIFVGDGSYALGKDVGFPAEKVIRPFYRVKQVPTIPGSSLKGVARSITEAISPSCITATRVAPGRLPEGVELAQSYRSGCKPTHSCPACSIFGRMNQLGKARFGDAKLVGGRKLQTFRLAPLYAPQAFKSPPGYLGKKKKFKGLKFYHHSQPSESERQPPVEVIPKGRKVQGQVDFENLTAAEMGLLFFALGMDGSIALKLGGGKPLGLGSLRIFTASLTLFGPDHYLRPEADEKRYQGQELSHFVGQQIEAAINSKFLLTTQALALAEILTYNPKRQAPEGAY